MLAQPVIKKKDLSSSSNKQDPVKEEDTKTSSDSKPTPQPIFYSNQDVPVSRMLFMVVNALKEENRPLNNQEIINKTLFDVEGIPALLKAVKANERITVHPDGTYEFKPRYQIRTGEQLLALLKQQRGVSGMDVKELKQSYTGVTNLIDV